MVEVLTDADVRRLLTPDRAIRWVREILRAHHDGRLHAPPRATADLGAGRMVFTTGALEGMWFGYRSYDTLGHDPGDQVVVVHDARDGSVRGTAFGNALGPCRTGAIGGVAADLLARRNATVLALVGTGVQAWEQLRAIAVVRALTDVRVHSRDPARRADFALRVQTELGLRVRDVADVPTAVDGADVVVLATSSPSPVLDPAWLPGGCYVATLGPKQQGRSELGPDLAAACARVLTDSPAQMGAYDPPHVLVGTDHEHRLVPLSAVAAGAVAGRTGDEETLLFCSVGLAGTEVHLLHRMLGGAAPQPAS